MTRNKTSINPARPNISKGLFLVIVSGFLGALGIFLFWFFFLTIFYSFFVIFFLFYNSLDSYVSFSGGYSGKGKFSQDIIQPEHSAVALGKMTVENKVTCSSS